ncbi:unnamed protein product [Coccothraustes coccothraustes]
MARGLLQSLPTAGTCCWAHPRLGWRVTLASLSRSSEHSPFLSKPSLYTPAVGEKRRKSSPVRIRPKKPQLCGAWDGLLAPGHRRRSTDRPRPSPGVQSRSSEPLWELLPTEGCYSQHVLLPGRLYRAQLRVKASKFWTREEGSE